MKVVVFSFIIYSTLVAVYSVSVSSTSTPTTPEDATNTPLNSAVPLEFPESNQNYTFVDNSSIRANLANHSKNDTEVDDLLGNDKDKISSTTQIIPSQSTLPPINFKPNPSEEDEDLNSKNDTELIENGDNTEDKKFVTDVNLNITKIEASTYNKEETGLLNGHIAAILAGVFLILSIFGYVGLLMWRRFLEMKYGSREMLVNEDDFIDPDDMKHFSI